MTALEEVLGFVYSAENAKPFIMDVRTCLAVLAAYGTEPTFIVCSATVANPSGHAQVSTNLLNSLLYIGSVSILRKMFYFYLGYWFFWGGLLFMNSIATVVLHATMFEPSLELILRFVIRCVRM